MKYLVLIPDGMADERVEALGNMIHLANHSYDSVSRRLQGTAVFQTE